jgi:adenylate cyclase
MVRRLPPFLCAPTPGRADDCLPTLALASFASLLPAPQLRLHAGRGLLAPAWLLDVESDGTLVASLPLARDGTLVVPYRHRASDWTSIAATDILSGSVDPALLQGSMVLIGSTALGLSDVIATPFKSVAGGFEPHAEILSALLDDDFAYAPRWGWLLDAALLLPLALLLAGAALRYRLPSQHVAVFPLWLAGSWSVLAAVAVLGLNQFNLLLPLLPLLLFPPLALSFVVLAELYLAGRSRIGALAILSAYLPRPVARRLALIGHASTGMDVTRREITVLFADVRGFSGISESHSPEIVGSLMQRVFSEMAEAVALHHGTIDKFIGDAIMAFWNAPDDDAQHAQHALAAAQEIQRRIQGLASYCEALQVRPLQVGIGIETGIA